MSLKFHKYVKYQMVQTALAARPYPPHPTDDEMSCNLACSGSSSSVIFSAFRVQRDRQIEGRFFSFYFNLWLMLERFNDYGHYEDEVAG